VKRLGIAWGNQNPVLPLAKTILGNERFEMRTRRPRPIAGAILVILLILEPLAALTEEGVDVFVLEIKGMV
jgi:hypothetical protein